MLSTVCSASRDGPPQGCHELVLDVADRVVHLPCPVPTAAPTDDRVDGLPARWRRHRTRSVDGPPTRRPQRRWTGQTGLERPKDPLGPADREEPGSARGGRSSGEAASGASASTALCRRTRARPWHGRRLVRPREAFRTPSGVRGRGREATGRPPAPPEAARPPSRPPRATSPFGAVSGCPPAATRRRGARSRGQDREVAALRCLARHHPPSHGPSRRGWLGPPQHRRARSPARVQRVQGRGERISGRPVD
jgi:hypothetical protein